MNPVWKKFIENCLDRWLTKKQQSQETFVNMRRVLLIMAGTQEIF